jgi:exonuclease 3'-5' domain-containing protein 2
MTNNLGTEVCKNPLTVRLNFDPAGTPSTMYDQYYLLERLNMCVVCGSENLPLYRKNIVPQEYRRKFLLPVEHMIF